MKYYLILFYLLNFLRISVFFSHISYSLAYQLGIENLSANILILLQQGSVGIVTNQTGVDHQGKRTIDILRSHDISLKKIFTPEHGFQGTVAAEKAVADSYDKNTDIPVVSLYQADGPKKITCQMLEGIDTLIFDMQDSGMRHYTYISLLYKIMEAAAACDKAVVVLDRPNPLGIVMEGPLVDAGLESFISIAPIPLRYGLTIGELAHYFNEYRLSKKVSLMVVPMKNYTRRIGMGGKLPVMLSPNLTTVSALWGYSFLGLLGEMQPFDVLVGTPHAFTGIMLAADMKISSKVWNGLIVLLAKQGAKAWHYSYFNIRKKKQYHGVRFAITDINRFQAFETLLAVLDFFKINGVVPTHYGPSFDKAVGTKQFKEYMQGRLSRQQFAQNINQDLDSFARKIQKLLLYKPLPEIKSVSEKP